MDLFFLRHGAAFEREAWNGSDDARPLTAEGVTGIEREAKALANLKVRPTRILTSPLIRARQTAEIIAEGLGLDAAAEESLLAPGFTTEALRRILAAQPRADSLLFVGHEPDFSLVVEHLIGGGRVELKKGGIARVRIDDSTTPRGTLLWLLPPRVLS